MNTYEFTTADGIALHVDVHCAAEDGQHASVTRPLASVLYFHGGGLLCGTRDDLPSQYLEMFTAQGYDVYCFDYPLAPESTIGQIHDAAASYLKWFLKQAGGPYFLFGRSAGAYLALYLAHTARLAKLPAPVGILSFYGYPGLQVPEFSRPSPYYNKLLSMNDSIVDRLTDKSGRPVTYGPLKDRYLLYVYARQTGKWLELMMGREQTEMVQESLVPAGTAQDALSRYSLTPEDLALLPPAFLTASSTDQDVPFGCSKRMARQIPGSSFHPVYNLEHDFDRETSRPEGREAYAQALKWMAGRQEQIVQADYGDVEAIYEIMADAKARLKDPDWYCIDTPEYIRKYIAPEFMRTKNQGFTLKALVNGTIAGFLIVRYPGQEPDNLGCYLDFTPQQLEQTAHMESAAVLPAFRGRRLQKKLLDHAESYVRDSGGMYLMATVHPENRSSLGSFLDLGYEVAASLTMYGSLPRNIMIKRLVP